MQIAVTGATGFIGRNFVELAASRGHRISAMHRPGTPAKRRLKVALQSSEVNLRASDVRDRRSLAAAMTDAECVIHFAAAFRESRISPTTISSPSTSPARGTRSRLPPARREALRVLQHRRHLRRQIPGVTDESARPTQRTYMSVPRLRLRKLCAR